MTSNVSAQGGYRGYPGNARFGNYPLLLCLCGILLAVSGLGTVRAEPVDLPVAGELLFHGFDGPPPTGHSYLLSPLAGIATDTNTVLSGTGSLVAMSDLARHDFFKTPAGQLPGGRRYHLQFDYRILTCSPEAYFYCTCRSPKGMQGSCWDAGTFTWKGLANQTGSQRKKIALPPCDDYELILGINGSGGIVIDNLSVQEVWAYNLEEQGQPAEQEPAAPYEPYGICTHFDWLWFYEDIADVSRAMKLLADTGTQWIRVGASWAMLEPEAGNYSSDYEERLDSILDLADEFGLKVLFNTHGVPKWASIEPDHSNYWAFAPSDWNLWRQAINHLVERYGNRVQFWEVMNEPDWTFWRSSPADCVQFVRIAYTELKQLDPQHQILFGGLATDGVHAWDDPRARSNLLQDLYDLGLGQYFDILSLHPYAFEPNLGLLESLDKINTAWSVMDWNGDGNKRIWVTELGVPTAIVGEDLQARYLDHAYRILPSHPQVDKVFWYNLRCKNFEHQEADPLERSFGLLNTDFSPLPAFKVWENLGKRPHRFVVPNMFERDPR